MCIFVKIIFNSNKPETSRLQVTFSSNFLVTFIFPTYKLPIYVPYKIPYNFEFKDTYNLLLNENEISK